MLPFSRIISRVCSQRTTGPTAWVNRRSAVPTASSRKLASTPAAPRVLFCGLEFKPATEEAKRRLPGWDVVAVDRSQVLSTLYKQKFDVVVPLMYRVDKAAIDAAKANGTTLIQQFGTGLEGVDLDAAQQAGIPVQNIGSLEVGNAASCAEFVFFQLLSLLRQPPLLTAAIKDRQLGTPMGKTLMGRTAVLIGFGAIGKELSQRLQAFGVRVLAFRDCKWPADEVEMVHGHASFEEHGQQGLIDLVQQSSIVAVCCPLNRRTFEIVDDKVLAALPKGGFLINVARGGVVGQQALISALKSGHLGGAAVDVYWKEPFDPEDEEQGGARPMMALQAQGYNVLCSPHVAGVTEASIQGIAIRFAQLLQQHLPRP